MDARGCCGFLVLGTYNLVSRDSFVTFLWLVVSSLANIGVYIYIYIFIYTYIFPTIICEVAGAHKEVLPTPNGATPGAFK